MAEKFSSRFALFLPLILILILALPLSLLLNSAQDAYWKPKFTKKIISANNAANDHINLVCVKCGGKVASLIAIISAPT